MTNSSDHAENCFFFVWEHWKWGDGRESLVWGMGLSDLQPTRVWQVVYSTIVIIIAIYFQKLTL